MTVIFCDLKNDPWLCGRSAVMGLVSVLTLLLVTIHITRTYMVKRGIARCSHQLLVIYLSLLQCLLGVTYWLFVNEFEVFITIIYLKFVQFVLIVYFFLSLALRLSKKAYLVKFMALPAAILYVIYLSAVLIATYIGVSKNSKTCQDPVWIAFYSSGFFMSIFFVCIAAYVTHVLKAKTVSPKLRTKKLAHLWSLVLVNFVTLAIGMFYVIRLAILRPGQTDCLDMVGRKPFAAVLYVTVCTIDLFLPIWVMCYVFFRYNFRLVKMPKNFPSHHDDYLVPQPDGDVEAAGGASSQANGRVNVLQIHGQGTGAPYFLMTSDSPQMGLGISYASDQVSMQSNSLGGGSMPNGGMASSSIGRLPAREVPLDPGLGDSSQR